MNVLPPTVMKNSKSLIDQKYRTTWILTVSAHTCPMESQMETSEVCFGSGCLWSQICQEVTRGSSYQKHPKYYLVSVVWTG